MLEIIYIPNSCNLRQVWSLSKVAAVIIQNWNSTILIQVAGLVTTSILMTKDKFYPLKRECKTKDAIWNKLGKLPKQYE